MDVGLVCDLCHAFNPMGAAACSRCGGKLSLDEGASSAGEPAASGGGAPPATAQGTAQIVCGACGAVVPTGHRFCGQCGAPVGADASAPVAAPAEGSGANPAPSAEGGGKRTMFFGAMQASRAKLVLIKGDGMDGLSYSLAGDDHSAGRSDDCDLGFREDPFLSPVHSNFFYRDGKLVVRDEASANGVFVRLRGSKQLTFGDRFLVGEQLLEVQETPADGEAEPRPDGTYFFASPRRPSRFRIVQTLRGGDTGLAYRAESDVVSVGREGNDINFPDDPFISGHHAQVACTDALVTLTDLDSKNGTFVRVNGEQVLNHGDYVFMGQQLLRVEIV